MVNFSRTKRGPYKLQTGCSVSVGRVRKEVKFSYLFPSVETRASRHEVHHGLLGCERPPGLCTIREMTQKYCLSVSHIIMRQDDSLCNACMPLGKGENQKVRSLESIPVATGKWAMGFARSSCCDGAPQGEIGRDLCRARVRQ